MTTIEVDSDNAVASLTGALVASNDRLLGLLALITADAPPSLDVAEMVDWVLDRAAAILTLDQVQVCGKVNHHWGQQASPQHTWVDRPATTVPSELVVTYGRNSTRFDTADTKLLAAVSALISNVVATAELHRSQLDQQLIASEHDTAAQITTLALPDSDERPAVGGLSWFCDLVPARTTGGDLYTWREIDGDLWFAMGDVSGKGLPAAILMSTIVSTIEASLLRSSDNGPQAVITDIEQLMYRRLSDASMFVTLVLARWSPSKHELEVVNCGHSPVVFCRDGSTERVEATAPPIGVVEGLLPDPWAMRTRLDDVLVLATDGFTEQVNQHGSLFGEEQFDRAISAATVSTDSAEEIGQSLLGGLREFSAGCEQADDRALMVVRFE